MTVVLQIAPEIGPGSGVAAVAYQLEQQFQARGITTARFTLAEARGDWLPDPGPGIGGKVATLAQVMWFSTVGTALARRALRRSPDVVAICHNDALAGDVYVNHGIVLAAMRARGHALLRMGRNPLHLFTWARDTVRFTGRAHRVVVNLTQAEDRLLRQTYGRIQASTAVIGNGVDTVRLRPPTTWERDAAREAFGFTPDDVVLLFVGHEFDRKGLPALIDAMRGAPSSVRLLVVGGTRDLVDAAGRRCQAAGIVDRVHFAGPLEDPEPAYRAADLFGLPSAYESFGLVVLEALAYGLPVLATPVGVVPDVVQDGANGYIVTDTSEVRDALGRFAAADHATLASAARASAVEFDWGEVAERYVDLLESLGARFVSGTAPVDADARAT